MKRLITSLAVGGMLVAGAVVAVAGTSAPAEAQEVATTVDEEAGRGEVALDEVLDGLVADGVITEAQSEEVRAAFMEKRAEIAAEREARRAERSEQRELIRGFLEDDVIDEDELAQLPDDHRWFEDDSPLAEALEDGELTRDELREAAPAHTHRHRHPLRGQADGDATGEETTNT